jgi:dihydrofolate reductase
VSKPRISLIVAVSANRVIGKNNEIPWHVREDLRRFRTMTEGKTIIVGRTTFEQLRHAYESRGKSLPDRNHIIVTKQRNYLVNLPKCFVCHSIDDAIQKAKEIENDEIFIAGGATIYEQTIDLVERLYLTKVDIIVDGDAFFPEYSTFTKVITEESKEINGMQITYLTLEKSQN